MGKVNGKSVSVSFRVDAGVIEHNNRKFFANNVDRSRTGDNIIYQQRNIHEMYKVLFGKALKEYNAKQTRADRKISNYYEHIKNDGKLKPFYEVIVQFGDVESCGLKSGNWETAKQMLDEYMRGFEERNPNLKVFNAVMHLDEATPHLHIDFIPVAHKNVKGLSVKNSMRGALREQGFTSSCKTHTEWTAWEERERDIMIDILRNRDLNRDVKNIHREHLTVDEYKQVAATAEKIREINAHLNELTKKNDDEYTAEETAMIKNQNNFMRSEILKRDKMISSRDEMISSLSRKVGAKFIPFDIYSEDKLQFVAAELEKVGVPFVEANTALHIPDYAQKTAADIAASFRPTKVEGIRNSVRFDIDRLVYCSVSLDDLFNKLRERGYQIKNGKHIAVKPKSAERFVRLKTLGEAYVPKKLEQRIADKDKFPNAVREKYNTANTFEKEIYVTIMDMVVEVKQFKLTPRKYDPKKIYTLQNDAEINYLTEQLITIRDFNFGSREEIYSKAEELKDGIDEKNAKVKNLSEELSTLKSDIAQLKFFFSAMGNSQRHDTMETVKLAAAREIVDKYSVKSEVEIASLEKRAKQLQSTIASVKQDLSEDQLKQKRVSDLIAVYEKIVDGNYIDNLIRAQKEQSRTPDIANQSKQNII